MTDVSADVSVLGVGGGPAGCTAALQARELGAHGVIGIVERAKPARGHG